MHHANEAEVVAIDFDEMAEVSGGSDVNTF